jgi:rare lipoprotein A
MFDVEWDYEFVKRLNSRILTSVFFVICLYLVSGCVHYQVVCEVEGTASWYGKKYHGNKTASGEKFNMYAKTAAHQSLAFGTKVRVINLENNRKVILRINDRGPFIDDRIIDVSYRAAKKLRFVKEGLAHVLIQILQ